MMFVSVRETAEVRYVSDEFFVRVHQQAVRQILDMP